MKIKTAVLIAALAGFSQLSSPAFAQNSLRPLPTETVATNDLRKEPIDEDIEMMRKDLRSEKKQIVAANMMLTEAEAERFWPVYDRFAAELARLNDSKAALLKEYILNYDHITNERADRYLAARTAAEEAAVQLRLKYIPIFRKVLSGKATALFFQLEWRVDQMMDLQLASQVPLIER